MKNLLAGLIATLALSANAYAAAIVVGTDAGFAPYEFKDPKTNEIVGFDIDLIKATIEATGNEAKIQNMQFAGLIPALQTNMIDVAASGMTITPERLKQIAFSDPYYEIGGLVMVVQDKKKGQYSVYEDLENKRVCAQIGSTGAIQVGEIKGAKLAAFDQIGEAFMELKMGGCEAVIVDKIVTEYYFAHKGGDGLYMVPRKGSSGKFNGFGIAKNNKEMLALINKGLKTIKENGTYDKIYTKWFGHAPEKK